MVASVLQRPTLVLNRNWQAMSVVRVERALVLVWNGSARIVDPEDFQTYDWNDWSGLAPKAGELFVQAVTRRFRVPEVVTLTHYDRLPQVAVAFSRRNIFKRDHYSCQYCGVQPGPEELTIDHVTPRSRGGLTRWDNCVLACIACNTRKADRTPDEARMKLRKAPVRPRWKPLYANAPVQIESWTKFVSEAYWSVSLDGA